MFANKCQLSNPSLFILLSHLLNDSINLFLIVKSPHFYNKSASSFLQLVGVFAAGSDGMPVFKKFLKGNIKIGLCGFAFVVCLKSHVRNCNFEDIDFHQCWIVDNTISSYIAWLYTTQQRLISTLDLPVCGLLPFLSSSLLRQCHVFLEQGGHPMPASVSNLSTL